MSEPIARQAGSALFWKATEHGGVKAIMVIRLFILARLLSPDDFGLMAVSLVAVEILAGLTDFGMIPALVQRPHADSRHYEAAWTVGLLRALVISGAVLVSAPLVARMYAEPRAVALIQVIALRPLLEALASVKVAELIRDLRLRSLTYIRLPEAIVSAVVAAGLAPLLGVWALVWGALTGTATVVVLSYCVAPWRPRLSLDREATRSLIQFGRWLYLAGVIGLVSSSLVSLIVSRQLGTAALGIYTLGARLAYLPAEISGSVIPDVTFPLYARLQRDLRKMARAFRSVLVGSFALLLPSSVLLIALAPALVGDVLGPKWDATVPIIRILTVVSIIGFLGDAIFPVLKGVGKPRRLAVVEAVQTPVLIACLYFFSAHWGLPGAALASVPAVVAAQLMYCWFAKDLLADSVGSALRPLLVIAALSAAGGAAAWGLCALMPGLFGLVVAAMLSLGGVAVIFWSVAQRSDLGLLDDLALAFPALAGRLRLTNRRS
ncbi:MAG: lipopolysaccharide biosynthesis protein [Thermoanaerobaculia bacterium]